jgi:hypothetical protein
MHLVRGDKTRIAEELGVNRLSVMYVLSGRIRSERILRALYEKALKNKHKSLYAYPKIAIEKLGGKTNE